MEMATKYNYPQINFGGNNVKLAHRIIAEQAIGKKLPNKAQVHHVDGDPTNNKRSNLVICPGAKYHKLLHRRQRALEEYGNASARKCRCCKKYDIPENLYISPDERTVFHKDCNNAQRREKRRIMKNGK